MLTGLSKFYMICCKFFPKHYFMLCWHPFQTCGKKATNLSHLYLLKSYSWNLCLWHEATSRSTYNCPTLKVTKGNRRSDTSRGTLGVNPSLVSNALGVLVLLVIAIKCVVVIMRILFIFLYIISFGLSSFSDHNKRHHQETTNPSNLNSNN